MADIDGIQPGLSCLYKTATSTSTMDGIDKIGLEAALVNAKKSYEEGGVPIGSALVYHGTEGESPRVLGAGHNQRVQKTSAILHGEMSALEAAGRLKADMYRASTMVRFVLIRKYRRTLPNLSVIFHQYTTLRSVYNTRLHESDD